MTTDTFPPAVVERVARALEIHETYVRAVLRALSPAAQAVIRGEAVAVPMEPTRDHMALLLMGEMTVGAKWALLLAASPYAEENTP